MISILGFKRKVKVGAKVKNFVERLATNLVPLAFVQHHGVQNILYFQLQKEVGYIEDMSVLIMPNDNLNLRSNFPADPSRLFDQ